MFYRLHFKFTSFGCLNKNLISQSFTFLQGLAHQVKLKLKTAELQRCAFIVVQQRWSWSGWEDNYQCPAGRASISSSSSGYSCVVFFFFNFPAIPAQHSSISHDAPSMYNHCRTVQSAGIRVRVKQSLCAGQRLSNASAPWALTAQLCSFRCC